MNIFSDYYEFCRVEGKKTRYDAHISTQSHPLLEVLLKNKIGGRTIYLVDRPAQWEGSLERRSDKALTKGDQNVSSLLLPDPSLNIGYGDIKGTDDAIIIAHFDNWQWFGLYICRGQKNNKLNIYQLVCDNEFVDEMYELVERAEEVTNNLISIKSHSNP